ncbi:xanthine phosphoribosyltransferase [Bacillus mycoides]|uniref:xanthine phosphoribosyltransferase n=1 Tax=Bacillus mycoides TaxID=1405 RepID=UPI001E5F7155|nr:xanthine phosphoribosyltransferase [Bacillus mycoides]MCD4642283.1 xanthine phosphoribosyltransferase [Bacillus mycoides]
MDEINNQGQPEQVKDVEETVEETQQNEEVVEEKTYSQEEVDVLQEQIDELSQYKPKELTDDEIKIQQKLESIWQREVAQTLKEEGVEVFADFINVSVDDTETLSNQITRLKEIIGQLELANGYKPTNHKQVDGYSVAKKNKDTKSMISQKLNF